VLQSLRLLIDSIPALIHSGPPDGSLDFFNQQWLDYVGLPLESLLGWKWTAAIHPEDIEELINKSRAALSKGEPFELEARVRRADGEYRRFLNRSVPLRDEKGSIIKWYGTLYDIEDLKRAEEQVRRSEAEIQQILDAAPQYLAVLGADRSRLYLNQAALEFFGLTLDGSGQNADPWAEFSGRIDNIVHIILNKLSRD
jgi:PAS domain S-box-containing protein